jgi:hypothetical protein
MGRKAHGPPSRELLRFRWLVLQYIAEFPDPKRPDAKSSYSFEQLTGVSMGYQNACVEYENRGRTGIGAEIVRLVCKGLELDTSYFYGDYVGEESYKVHLLSAKRDEKRVSSIEDRLSHLERKDAEKDTRIALMNEQLLGKDREIERLKAELRTRPRGVPQPRERR